MSEMFEMFMVICFGISWPISIAKSIRSRTAKGKSVIFSFLILFGYVCGIVSKLCKDSLTYVFIFYVINFVSVSIDILLYFRNRRLDLAKENC